MEVKELGTGSPLGVEGHGGNTSKPSPRGAEGRVSIAVTPECGVVFVFLSTEPGT